MPDNRLAVEDPELAPVNAAEELIRQRAYQLYEQRGCKEGYAVDDWLKAEEEINGKKVSEPAAVSRKKASSATAA